MAPGFFKKSVRPLASGPCAHYPPHCLPFLGTEEMSINVGHQVVIGDNDPRIQWGGNWFVWRDVGNLDVCGAPFLNTMHGFTTSGSNISFSYYGESSCTTIDLLTSIFLPIVGKDSWIYGVVTPPSTGFASWTCFFDGQEVIRTQLNYSSKGSSGKYESWRLCGGQQAEGYHTIQASFFQGEGTVWINSIQYLAASTSDIANEWEVLSVLDQRIQYSETGWQEDPGRNAKWTYLNGGSLIYDFIGTSQIKAISVNIVAKLMEIRRDDHLGRLYRQQFSCWSRIGTLYYRRGAAANIVPNSCSRFANLVEPSLYQYQRPEIRTTSFRGCQRRQPVHGSFGAQLHRYRELFQT